MIRVQTLEIPEGLKDCLKNYIAQCYGLQPNDRLFPYTKSYLTHEMERGCKRSGVKRIRIHDIRHSHASLLVEMGFPPPAADRGAAGARARTGHDGNLQPSLSQ